MNEEIRNNEIPEYELQNVSGGTGNEASDTCPKCGGKMRGTVPIEGGSTDIPKYICMACGYSAW